MADNSGIIKIGLFGAALYVAYTQGWLSFLGLGTATAASPATPATPVSPSAAAVTSAATVSSPAPVNPKANVLDSIWTATMKAANAPSAGLGIDAWGYYLNQQLAPLGLTAPDPVPIFTATPLIQALNQANPGGNFTYDRSRLVTASDYWTYMAPALRSQLGLSGLGIYGGFGALLRRYA